MRFAVIDTTCKSFERSFINEYFSDNNVPIKNYSEFPPENAPAEGSYDECIYIVNAEGGFLNHQYRFIENNKSISRFLVLIWDREGLSDEERQIILDDFLSKVKKFSVDVSALFFDQKSFYEIIQKGMLIVSAKRSFNVLITSRKNFVGKRTAKELFEKKYPEMNFSICPPKELEEKSRFAQKIIIIGCEKMDFSIPVPKIFSGEIVLILNKLDESPSKALKAEKTKKEIISVLNNNGWNISSEHKAFFFASLKYEAIHEKLSENAFSLKLNKDFYMWDEYGLPCKSDNYTDENVLNFIKKISISDIIFNH